MTTPQRTLPSLSWIREEWADEYTGAPFRWAVGLLVALVLTAAVGIPMAFREASTFVRDCAASEGHVHHAAQGPLCLTQDGRIVE